MDNGRDEVHCIDGYTRRMLDGEWWMEDAGCWMLNAGLLEMELVALVEAGLGDGWLYNADGID